MVSRRTVPVVNEQGLHARPCTRLVEIANRFRSEVAIHCNGTTANAKSVLALMTLAAPKGSELALEATGEDEDAAVAALAAEIERGFGE